MANRIQYTYTTARGLCRIQSSIRISYITTRSRREIAIIHTSIHTSIPVPEFMPQTHANAQPEFMPQTHTNAQRMQISAYDAELKTQCRLRYTQQIALFWVQITRIMEFIIRGMHRLMSSIHRKNLSGNCVFEQHLYFSVFCANYSVIKNKICAHNINGPLLNKKNVFFLGSKRPTNKQR